MAYDTSPPALVGARTASRSSTLRTLASELHGFEEHHCLHLLVVNRRRLPIARALSMPCGICDMGIFTRQHLCAISFAIAKYNSRLAMDDL